MKAIRLLRPVLLIGSLLLPADADACTVCASETGEEVRARIFGEDFGRNLLMVLLPFPLLLALAAALHFGASPRPAAAGRDASGPSTGAG